MSEILVKSEQGMNVKRVRGGAELVAAGIFLSRIAGLVRVRFFLSYFGGKSDAYEAFNAALKVPNILQNLLGEGVLSASFIPVYARLVGEEKSIEAGRVAGVIATLLATVASLLALIGVLLAPYLIPFIAPGFIGEKRHFTILFVQILFPGMALLVMSAWCLGVLNSHRRFFLSYAAPVVWNLTIISVLLLFGGQQSKYQLATTVAWGLVLGSLLQFAVQVPTVLRLLPDLRLYIELSSKNVRAILSSFSSVVVGRGVVQISGFIDNMLVTYLPTGAVTALGNAQIIYMIPISLFGMSVSAVSIAEMSLDQASGDELKSNNEEIRLRLNSGLKQVAFFIVPSTAIFVFLGDILGAALFQKGEYTASDVRYLWITLAGSGVGLLASALGRLYSSTFYAFQDTRTPLHFAFIRVVLTTILGYIGGIHVPGWLGISSSWGTVGLTATAGFSGWVEFALLRRALNRKIGKTGIPRCFLAQLWIPALIGVIGGWGVKLAAEHIRLGHPVIVAVFVFGVFGSIYLGGTLVAGVPQAQTIWLSVRRRLRLH